MTYFFDKMLMTLKNTGLVLFHVHAILLDFSARKRRWLIDNECTLVIFLAMCGRDINVEGKGSIGNEEYPCRASTVIGGVLTRL